MPEPPPSADSVPAANRSDHAFTLHSLALAHSCLILLACCRPQGSPVPAQVCETGSSFSDLPAQQDIDPPGILSPEFPQLCQKVVEVVVLAAAFWPFLFQGFAA